MDTTFSRRGDLGSEENAFSRALRLARARPLCDLSVGNATRVGLPLDARALEEAVGRAAAAPYEPDPLGPRSARQAIGARLGLDPARMLLTASTSEAYSLLLTLLTDPGDVVLVPSPSYPLFASLTQLAGVEAVPYRLRFDGAWYIDPESLSKAMASAPRALFYVSPNNPTGSYLRRAELERLLALGVPLVLDEVFAPYALTRPDDAVTSPFDLDEGLVFCLDGLSKRAAMPGMKLAWATAYGQPGQVTRAMARLEAIADTFLSPSQLVTRAAGALLDAAQPTVSALRERLRTNLAVATSRFGASSAASLLPVEGGWYACLRVPERYEPGRDSGEAWALELLARGVVLQPGYFFDLGPEAYLVMSLIAPEAEFARGIERVADTIG